MEKSISKLRAWQNDDDAETASMGGSQHDPNEILEEEETTHEEEKEDQMRGDKMRAIERREVILKQMKEQRDALTTKIFDNADLSRRDFGCG